MGFHIQTNHPSTYLLLSCQSITTEHCSVVANPPNISSNTVTVKVTYVLCFRALLLSSFGV